MKMERSGLGGLDNFGRFKFSILPFLFLLAAGAGIQDVQVGASSCSMKSLDGLGPYVLPSRGMPRFYQLSYEYESHHSNWLGAESGGWMGFTVIISNHSSFKKLNTIRLHANSQQYIQEKSGAEMVGFIGHSSPIISIHSTIQFY